MENIAPLEPKVLERFMDTPPILLFKNHVGKISVASVGTGQMKQLGRAKTVKKLQIIVEWIFEIHNEELTDDLEVNEINLAEEGWRVTPKTLQENFTILLDVKEVLHVEDASLCIKCKSTWLCMYLDQPTMHRATELLLKAISSSPQRVQS